MKKIIALLVSLMMVLSFAACSDDQKKDAKDIVEKLGKNVNDEINKKQATKADKSDDKSDEDVGDIIEKSGSKKSSKIPAIEEQVILDEADIKITAKELAEDEFNGTVLKILVENNSSEEINVSVMDCSINGIMYDAYVGSTVSAGKKSNEEIQFSGLADDTIIEEIKEIEFSFDIYNGDYDTIVETDLITIETDSKYKQEYDDSGEIIYDSNDLKIVIQGLGDAEDYYDENGAKLFVYMENNSNEPVYIKCEEFSINGYMIDGWLYDYIKPGCVAYSEVYFSGDDLMSEDIDGYKAIEDLTFDVEIVDGTSYGTIDEVDTVTLEF